MEIFKSLSILLVDDEPDIRELLCDEFEPYCAQIFEAENGVQALSVYLQNHVDVIISDIRMPGGSGIELFEQIKAKGNTPPYFYFMSGFADLNRTQALQIGAKELFSKPFDLNKMVQQIAQDLGKKK